MSFNTIKELIDYRIAKGNEEFAIEEYWKAAVELLSKDISTTIDFLLNKADDEEFFWLTENLEALAEKTQSYDLIHACRHRLEQVDKATYSQDNFKSKFMRENVDYEEYVRSTKMDIDYAEGQIMEMPVE